MDCSSCLWAVLLDLQHAVRWDGEGGLQRSGRTSQPKGTGAIRDIWTVDAGSVPSRTQQISDAESKGGEAAYMRKQNKVWKCSYSKTSSSSHRQKSLPET